MRQTVFHLSVFSATFVASYCAAGAFIENCGQWDGPARFMKKDGPSVARIQEGGISFLLREAPCGSGAPGRWTMFQLTFEGRTGPEALQGEGPVPGLHHFLLGNDPSRWQTNVPEYRRVIARGLYPGIDLQAREVVSEDGRGSPGLIEYDLLLEPGADLSRVVVRCDGVDGMSLDEDGSLWLETGLGPVRQLPHRSWEVFPGGEERPLECRFRLLGGKRFGFEAPGRDPGLALVVDPALEWSVPVGGAGEDLAWELALEAGGDAVMVGVTGSFDFPVVGNASDNSFEGAFDGFVTRLNGATGEVVYSTYLGGDGGDAAAAVAIDSMGFLSLAGYTSSDDLPVTNDSAYQGVPGDFATIDAFVARLSPAGDEIRFLTYLGGEGEDGASALSIDDDGNLVVSGWTGSPQFPTTVGAFQESYGGGAWDAFVARLRPDRESDLDQQLLYSTFVGGLGDENDSSPFDTREYLRWRILSGNHVLDREGNVNLVGITTSANFPSTEGAYDRTANGNGDGFFTRLHMDPLLPPEEQLVYSTLLGGGDGESVDAIAVDPAGGVFLAGYTWSAGFPTTPEAYSRAHHGENEVFVTHLDPNLPPAKQLVYSSLLGGKSYEAGLALRLDRSGALFVAGFTGSTDFPTTPGSLHESYTGGAADAFVAVLKPDPALSPAEQLLYSTFLPGPNSQEEINDLAIGPSGRVVAAGITVSAGFDVVDAFAVSLDLRLPHAEFTVDGQKGGPLRFDAASSTTPQGTEPLSYSWDFGDGATGEGILAEHAFPPGRFEVTLILTNSLGNTDLARKLLTSPCPSGDIAPWIQADVGDPLPTFPGAASLDGQDLQVCAGGKDIAGRSDSFHFDYQEVIGDATITARVAELTGSSLSKAGLMVRVSLEDGSPHGSLVVQKGETDSFRLLGRLASRASTSAKSGTSLPQPGNAWVRLERKVNTIKGSTSEDGKSWALLETLGDEDHPLPPSLFFGVAASGRDPGEGKPFLPARALIRDLKLEPATPPASHFRRGDADANGELDLTDAVALLGFLFLGGAKPACLDAADVDDNGETDISDAIASLNYQFLGGPPPASPGPTDCGPDSLKEDPDLGCDRACA